MFSYTYEPRYGDFKNYNEIKTGSVLDFIQDVSIKDSDRCGFSLDKMQQLNMAWLLQGINLHFEKPVKTHIPIEVSTAVKTLKGAISDRGCIIKQNGETVAKSIARWFIFSLERQRPCKIPAEMLDAYDFYEFNDDYFEFTKPEVFEIEDPDYTIRVSNKEIDTNMHLNNQKGADLLMDALPFDFRFNQVRILYQTSAFLDDFLDVCVKEIPKGYYVHLQKHDKTLCVASTFEMI